MCSSSSSMGAWKASATVQWTPRKSVSLSQINRSMYVCVAKWIIWQGEGHLLSVEKTCGSIRHCYCCCWQFHARWVKIFYYCFLQIRFCAKDLSKTKIIVHHKSTFRETKRTFMYRSQFWHGEGGKIKRNASWRK